jgi:hypothetical protein
MRQSALPSCAGTGQSVQVRPSYCMWLAPVTGQVQTALFIICSHSQVREQGMLAGTCSHRAHELIEADIALNAGRSRAGEVELCLHCAGTCASHCKRASAGLTQARNKKLSSPSSHVISRPGSHSHNDRSALQCASCGPAWAGVDSCALCTLMFKSSVQFARCSGTRLQLHAAHALHILLSRGIYAGATSARG